MSRRRGQPKAEEIPSPDSLSSEQALCLVGQSRGSNLFEVTDVTGRVLLAELPSKFRKNVWVRRGSYVIISRSDGDSTKIGGEIQHVVPTDQVKEWKRKGVWPAELDARQAAATDDLLPPEDDESGEPDEQETAQGPDPPTNSAMSAVSPDSPREDA